MKLKKFCEGLERYHGVGTVFITDGKDVERFDNCCFNAERGDIYGGDGELGGSLMVAFDEDKLDFVVNSMQMLIDKIRAGSRRNKILPQPRRADADADADAD